MYYIRKSLTAWMVHNRATRKSRALSQEEVHLLRKEFPLLEISGQQAQSTTLFRNRIDSIHNLP